MTDHYFWRSFDWWLKQPVSAGLYRNLPAAFMWLAVAIQLDWLSTGVGDRYETRGREVSLGGFVQLNWPIGYDGMPKKSEP